MEELKNKDLENLYGGALILSCCSLDIGIMTLEFDGFKINIGQNFNADYGMEFLSPYNRL